MSALSDDHRRLLVLARRALLVRDNKKLWESSPDAAFHEHGGACDALWAELEEQVKQHLGYAA